MGPIMVGGISLGMKLLSSLFGGKARSKQEEAQRQALIQQLILAQKQSERSRLARLGIGQSLLSNLKGNHAINLDPELMKRLGTERHDDFSKVVPKSGQGSVYQFLSGLFGGAADTLPYMKSTAPMSAPPGADMVGPVGSMGGKSLSEGGSTGALSIEDLMRLIESKGLGAVSTQPDDYGAM